MFDTPQIGCYTSTVKTICPSDKGKPSERLGHKAIGPSAQHGKGSQLPLSESISIIDGVPIFRMENRFFLFFGRTKYLAYGLTPQFIGVKI